MDAYIKNSVQEARTERGITQGELAEKVKVSRQTIIAVEKGHYAPSVLLALRIAKFFKMPVEQLFTIHHEK